MLLHFLFSHHIGPELSTPTPATLPFIFDPVSQSSNPILSFPKFLYVAQWRLVPYTTLATSDPRYVNFARCDVKFRRLHLTPSLGW
uniref:Uncharacterized protein n=1 Tax=Picea glauca TaxID=3330 RepID=A0A101LVU3_PICGL|nr:hypothetical protein ABT39_MTgene1810 [Picea glauca]QHR91836.1 hypothetical protein Q903MT_gene5872 [Picea sitchensis]